ncbi:hypothetical protein CRYUN_Cryun26dG0131900 [Craigia yunnanensis]
MASSTAGLLFGKIVSFLENEALLLGRVRDEINKIKRELNTMKSFLDDANIKGVHSKIENEWVASVRDIIHEVEDVIDKYTSMIREIYKKKNEEINPMNLNTMSYSGNGSWVLLTTRVDEVAFFEFGVVNYIIPLKPLKDAEPWTLFYMRAFLSNFGRCLPYLDSLAANLVEKCGGLPLALVALGGLMSSKKSIVEWQFVLNNLNWELSNNPVLEAMKCISLLAYHHLPYRLKHCFLYCCMFPEDHMI